MPLRLEHPEGQPLAVRSVGKDKFCIEFVRFSGCLDTLQKVVVALDREQRMLFEASLALDVDGS